MCETSGEKYGLPDDLDRILRENQLSNLQIKLFNNSLNQYTSAHDSASRNLAYHHRVGLTKTFCDVLVPVLIGLSQTYACEWLSEFLALLGILVSLMGTVCE